MIPVLMFLSVIAANWQASFWDDHSFLDTRGERQILSPWDKKLQRLQMVLLAQIVVRCEISVSVHTQVLGWGSTVSIHFSEGISKEKATSRRTFACPIVVWGISTYKLKDSWFGILILEKQMNRNRALNRQTMRISAKRCVQRCGLSTLTFDAQKTHKCENNCG